MDDRSDVVVRDLAEAGKFAEYSIADAAKVLMSFEQVNNVVVHSAFVQSHCESRSKPSLAAVAAVFACLLEWSQAVPPINLLKSNRNGSR